MQDTRKTCGICGKPALITCLDCGVHVYCGEECQARDMPIHSTICKELELERAIIRTADTIQKAYFAFREPLFEKPIVKVEERNHELVLHQDNTESGKKKGWVAGLPDHLTRNKGTAEAILCVLMGREPLAYLLDMIRYLTDGTVPAVLNNNQAYTM